MFFSPDQPQVYLEKHVSVYDDLRALACVCVVIYHAAGGYASIQDIPGQAFDWWAGNIYTGLAINFLAPIFFIVSGAALLSPDRPPEPISVYLKKRARSIFPPFLAASFIYYIYAHGKTGGINLLYFLSVFLGEPQYYHLWFFYTLIGLYFIVPVLSPLFTPENRNRVEYLLLLWVLVTGVVPLIQKFTAIKITIFPTMFYNYTGYFLFGAYFFHLRRWNLKKPWAGGLTLLMTLITWFGTWFLSLSDGRYDNFFANQLGLNIIISTLCLVSFFGHDPLNGFQQRHPRGLKIIHTLSRDSLYIYIFHPLTNDILSSLLPFLKSGSTNPIFRIPLTAMCSIGLIVFICEGISKISFMVFRRRRPAENHEGS